MESAQASHDHSSEVSQPTTRRQARIPKRRRRPAFPRRALSHRPDTAWGRVLAVGSAVVVLLAVWALIASLTAKHDGAAPVAEGVTASADYKAGDCFADFDAKAQSNRVVSCTDAHSAQLVAISSYAAGDTYPGKDALGARAAELCRETKTSLPQDTSNLRQSTGFPTEDSWGKGDRRVDCFIVTTNGNLLKTSLLP